MDSMIWLILCLPLVGAAVNGLLAVVDVDHLRKPPGRSPWALAHGLGSARRRPDTTGPGDRIGPGALRAGCDRSRTGCRVVIGEPRPEGPRGVARAPLWEGRKLESRSRRP